MDRAENIRRLKEQAAMPRPKKAYSISKKSKKKLKQEAEEKKLRGSDDTLIEQWYKARRKELTGTCQCGCGNKSQKDDDTFFRGSCCHVFPKATFESIMYHPLNCVERAMFGGCAHRWNGTCPARRSGRARPRVARRVSASRRRPCS